MTKEMGISFWALEEARFYVKGAEHLARESDVFNLTDNEKQLLTQRLQKAVKLLQGEINHLSK